MYVLLALAACLAKPKAHAQVGCVSESDTGPYVESAVCNLNDAQLPYDSLTTQPQISFLTTSCGGGLFGGNCTQAVSYRVRLSSTDFSGSNFLLTGSSGNIPVSINFNGIGGTSQLLLPNMQSSVFPGSQTPDSVSLSVSIAASDPSLAPGNYQGYFEFHLEQEQHCQQFIFWPVCKQTNVGPIGFEITVTVEPKIRISGLSDMAITANPSGLTEAQQTFCVYSQGAAPFGITATSGNGSGSFLLAGSLDQLEYETWVQSLTAGGLHQLTEGQSSSQLWPGSLWEQCAGGSGENMQLSIRIQPIALADAMESSYSDTLTLTVELN